jgi:arginine/serine-rich splicing factor 12
MNTEGFDPQRTIYVTNIAAQVTEPQLREFFGFCGEISRLKTLGYALLSDSKYGLVEFKDSSHVSTALLLNSTPFLGKPLQITPLGGPAVGALAQSTSSSGVPDEDASPPPSEVKKGEEPDSASPTTPPVAASSIPLLNNPLMQNLLKQQVGIPGLLPTPLPPHLDEEKFKHIPPNSNMQKMEEVARTVYVGNINGSVTPEQLMNFFSVCGPISFCRMAGDSSHPARFAFIEFTTLASAQAALALNNTTLVDRPIRVNHSKNPIVKPQIKAPDPKKDDEILRAVKERMRALAHKIKVETGEDIPESRGQRSRSRSRSPDRKRRSSRSRSPRRKRSRSRSRSPRRKRSRSRSRDSGRYSDKRRDRDRDRRDRDRHKRRSRSRSKERRKRRSRSRSTDKDRKKRSRSKSRDRDSPSKTETNGDTGSKSIAKETVSQGPPANGTEQ